MQNEANRAGAGGSFAGVIGFFGFFGFVGIAFGLFAGGLEVAELVEDAVELAGEALLAGAEGGEGAGLFGEALGDGEVGVGGIGGREVGGGFGESGCEELGLERGDAVEAPGGVGEGLDEVFFEGADGQEFIDEAAAVELVGGGVLGGQDGGVAEEAVAERVEGGALLAGVGAGASGELGVFAIGGGAAGGGRGLGGLDAGTS